MTKLRDVWVGLDAGADDLYLCVVDATGKSILEREIRCKPAAVDGCLSSLRGRVALIGLEAGTSGSIMARGLRDLGYQVAVFHTRRSSKFLAIRTNKTDANDARGLAELARVGNPEAIHVHVKSKSMDQLRTSVSLRHSVMKQRVAFENVLRSNIRVRGGRMAASWSETTFLRRGEEALAHLAELEGSAISDIELRPLLQLCASMRAYSEACDKCFREFAEADEVCRRFMEIPGIGPLCALSFYSTVADPFRFRRNSDVGAYLGMVPSLYQSGQTTHTRRISKAGNAMTRGHLVTAALVHLQHGDTSIADWGRQLVERVGKPRARVAVGRKIGVVMLAMWKTGEKFDAKRVSLLPPITS